jgi:hypothetical protein
MPRGKSQDTLPEEVASKVRISVAEARALKGLTNASLAKHLRWDNRTVTNVLQSGRPLRLLTAKSILSAVTKMAPWRNDRRLAAGEESLAIHEKAMKILAPSLAALANIPARLWPAALIASGDVDILAKRLTDAIIRRGGFSERKRREIDRAIAGALMANAENFWFAAVQRLTNHYVLPLPAFKDRDALHIISRFVGHRIKYVDISASGGAKAPPKDK